MSVTTYSMKLHRMTDVTNQFDGLNDCIVHGKKPTVWEKVVGRRKDVVYTVECSMKKEDEGCGRCGERNKIVEIWNKHNPQNV